LAVSRSFDPVSAVRRKRSTGDIGSSTTNSFTYDQIFMKIMDPVCSPIFKHERGRLVLRWVTTGESLLLYVFVFLLLMEGGDKRLFLA
jgi:hypothetical protein